MNRQPTFSQCQAARERARDRPVLLGSALLTALFAIFAAAVFVICVAHTPDVQPMAVDGYAVSLALLALIAIGSGAMSVLLLWSARP